MDFDSEEFEKFDGLWRGVDRSGNHLFTQIPNPILHDIFEGIIPKIAHVKIVLYIARMTFGFRKEESHYLDLSDFSKVVGMKNHISEYVNDLLDLKIIFRTNKNGNKYKYSINLLKHDKSMKHFKLCQKGYVLGKGECILGEEKLEIRSSTISKDSAIVYSAKGYSK